MNYLNEYEKEKQSSWDIVFAILMFPIAFPLFLLKKIITFIQWQKQ